VATPRERLHELLDELPEDRLKDVRAALAVLGNGDREELLDLVSSLPSGQAEIVLAFARFVHSGGLLEPRSNEWVRSMIAQLEPADAANGPADDPMIAMLDAAPEDNEPLTDEDREAIAEGVREYRGGEFVSAAEAKRRHGIT